MNPRGEFRTVHTALINGPDFQRLPERSRALFLFLKLNFGPAGIEVWYPDELVARLVRQSGMAASHVSANLEVLEHEGWVRRADNIVWIVGQLDYDPYLNPNDAKHRKMVAKHVAGLPRCEIVRLFIRSYEAWFRPDEGSSQGLAWAFSESVLPLRSPVPIPDPAPEPEPKSGRSASRSADAEPASLSWVQEGVAWWGANVGKITHPRFGAALKDVTAQHGWGPVFLALQKYAAAQKKAQKPAKLEWFAEDVVRWLPKAVERDENGDPTASTLDRWAAL